MEKAETKTDVLVAARRSVRYHLRRVRFFDAWNRRIAVATLFSGTAVAATLIASAPVWIGIAFGGTVAALQAIDLLAGTAAKARLHSDLARSFIGLERELTLADTNAPVAPFIARRLDIEADEPPVLRWLDLLCHNEMSRSEFGAKASLYEVSFIQRLFANWADLSEVRLKRV